METFAVVAVVAIALVFDFVNGFHDAANSIATVVSTRVLTPRLAVVWAAVFNFVAFLVFSVVGIGWFQIAGGGAVYGGTKEKIIGFSVLGISILLFLFRRIVQDKEKPHWREETPTMPDEAPVAQAPAAAS